VETPRKELERPQVRVRNGEEMKQRQEQLNEEIEKVFRGDL